MRAVSSTGNLHKTHSLTKHIACECSVWVLGLVHKGHRQLQNPHTHSLAHQT